MSLREFIRAHRADIDAVARSAGHQGKLNDSDRADWIANDEGLYLWAKSCGVEV